MFNLNTVSNYTSQMLDCAETLSGLKHIKVGIRELKQGNYKNALRNIVIGSLPTLIVVTSVLALRNRIVAGNLNPVQINPNDLCQSTNSTLSTLCHDNLGIPRSQMPQVAGEVLDNFLSTRDSVSHIAVPATDLTPMQSEMNLEKVEGIVNATLAGRYDPCSREILVTQTPENELYVVDGHHSYAACALVGGVQKVVMIAGEALDVLADLNHFPGVMHAAL